MAFLNGMRDAGMMGTAKHFPGHGAVAPDSHVAMPVDRRELADMDDDLYPYQRLIDNGLASIMAAHVVFSAVDPLPAGFSRKWLQNELRGRMGFTGAIFSDDLNMAGAGSSGTCRSACEPRLGPAATWFLSVTIAKVCSKSSNLCGEAKIL